MTGFELLIVLIVLGGVIIPMGLLAFAAGFAAVVASPILLAIGAVRRLAR